MLLILYSMPVIQFICILVVILLTIVFGNKLIVNLFTNNNQLEIVLDKRLKTGLLPGESLKDGVKEVVDSQEKFLTEVFKKIFSRDDFIENLKKTNDLRIKYIGKNNLNYVIFNASENQFVLFVTSPNTNSPDDDVSNSSYFFVTKDCKDNKFDELINKIKNKNIDDLDKYLEASSMYDTPLTYANQELRFGSLFIYIKNFKRDQTQEIVYNKYIKQIHTMVTNFLKPIIDDPTFLSINPNTTR